MAKAKLVSKAKQAFRLDGWKNILTGLGVKGKDKRLGAIVEWCPLTEEEADSLYSASDTAGKIVDEIVDDAFREGYTMSADDQSLTPEVLAAITDEGTRLAVDEKLAEAAKYARIYGGSGIVLIPNDVTKLNTPFVPSQVVEVKSLLVLTRWELVSEGTVETDIRSPNFGKPVAYRICPRSGQGATNEVVHHSRVLRFDGAFLPKQKFVANNYWHDSILNKCKAPIRDYDSALDSISSTLSDFSIAVMKIKDLRQTISEDRDDIILKRMEIANLGRSVAKTIMLDADSESYEYQDRQLTGVGESARMVAGRLVVASGMPHTKILGESPQGSNATGNSTTKDWYDKVGAWQENWLDSRAVTLWRWILQAKKSPTKGVVPKGFKLIYAPLWQEPDSVKADVRLKTSQADALDITNGVLDPNEVAVSRYGSGEYSTETKLIADRKNQEKNPNEET